MNQETMIENIGPTKAAEYLGLMKNNRPLRKSHMLRLASDMATGRWRLTHQGIAFDGLGKLVDGHHRLRAVIESDTTVPMNVTRNMDPESVAVLDSGARRSVLDAAVFCGVTGMNKHIASMARSMYMGFDTRSDRPLTTSAMLDFIEVHKAPLTFAFGVLHTVRFRIVNAPVRAAFARAWYHLDKTILSRCASILMSGIVEDGIPIPGDRTILALRRSLDSNPNTGGIDGQRKNYGKTTLALAVAAAGSDRDSARVAEKELFPLP